MAPVQMPAAPAWLDRSNYVKVKTTLPVQPFPDNETRPSMTTERLLLRPFRQDDLAEFYALRTQPEIMVNTSRGLVDDDLAFTQSRMDPFLPPKDVTTYNYVMCLKEVPDVLIGAGGCHRFYSEFGWPTLGYFIKYEYWGKGYMGEFVNAWLQLWRALPRHETELSVDPRTIPAGLKAEESSEAIVVPELITAVILSENVASTRIVTRCGFKEFTRYEEPDSRNTSVNVLLVGFGLKVSES